MTKSRTLRKAGAIALSLAMAFSVAGAIPASAAAKAPKLSSTKGTITVGKTKKVKIKNVTKAKVKKLTVKSSKKSVAKAKTSGKVAFKVTGKKAGKATVTAKVTLKKAIKVSGKNKKTFTLKYKATVKNASTPTEAPTEEPAKPATAIALDQATLSLVEGATTTLTASVTPVDTTDAIEWSSSDTSVATVSAGVVTAVKAGTATITVKAGEFSATCEVTVTPADIVANLTEVKQTKSNELQLTFDTDYRTVTGGFKKEDIKIDKMNNGVAILTIPVNTLSWSEDGKVATAVLASALSDKTDYEVSYQNGTKVNLTASVGSVKTIGISTVSAEENVPTEVKYALYDEAGVDVTSTVSLNDTISIEFTGSGDTDTSASKPMVTLAAVGDTATITIKYNDNTEGFQDIVATGTITCTEAQPVVGKGVFASAATAGVNANSKCAKFYRGASDSSESIVEGGSKTVYFTALDEAGAPINYNKYSFAASDEDVIDVALAATDGKDSGLFTNIDITGKNPGTANVVITATKNGKDSFYTIPVTVTKPSEFASINVTRNKSTLTNAVDSAYFGSVIVEALDSNKNPVKDVSVSFEVKGADGKAGKDALDTNAALIEGANGVSLSSTADTSNALGKVVSNYYAPGAKAQSYTVEVKASKGDKEFSKKVSFTVEALPANAYKADGIDLVYQVEASGTTLDAAPGSTTQTGSYKLYATAGGKFAGYVHADGKIGTGNGLTATGDSIVTIGTNNAFTLRSRGTEALKDIGFDVKENRGKKSVYDGAVFKISSATNSDVLNGVEVIITNNSTAEQAASAKLTYAESKFTLAIVNEGDGTKATPLKNDTLKALLNTGIDIKDSSIAAGDVATKAAAIKAALQDPAITVAAGSGSANAFADGANDDVTGENGVAAIATEEGAVTLYYKGTVTESMIQTAIRSAASTVGSADVKKALANVEVAKNGNGGLTDGSKTWTVDAYAGAGSVVASAKTRISDIVAQAKYGIKYGTSGNLFDQTTNINSTTKDTTPLGGSEIAGITLKTVNGAGLNFYVKGDDSKDGKYARAGKYYYLFDYKLGGVATSVSKDVTVKNSIWIPTITDTSRTVGSLDGAGVKAVCTTNVDMNNNDGQNVSIVDGAYKSVNANGDTVDADVNATANSITVNYMAVVEDGVTFYIPIKKTFKTA